MALDDKEDLPTEVKFSRSTTPTGLRLYAKAADINLRHERLRQEAKAREEEQAASMFQPHRVTKHSPRKTNSNSTFERLYEYSKLKQMREVARKQAAEIQKLQTLSKKKTITPQKATGLYERSIAMIQQRDKKVKELAESMIPTFEPKFATKEEEMRNNSRSKSNPKSRSKSRGREGRDSIGDRLYKSTYMQQREDKRQQIKAKMEEDYTFTPNSYTHSRRSQSAARAQSASRARTLGTPQSIDESPAWDRLYSRAKFLASRGSPRAEVDYTFKPNISESQKRLSSSNINGDGAKVYDRLYKNHEFREKRVDAPVDQELTFKPVINTRSRKDDISREDRIDYLYKKGMRSVEERRSMELAKLPKVEKKSEEDELTFMPKTNWRKSRRSYPRPKGGRTGTFESLVNETMDDMNIGKVPRKMNRDSEEDVEKAFDQKLNDFKKEIEEMGQDDDALSEANQPSVSHPGSVVSEPPLSYY